MTPTIDSEAEIDMILDNAGCKEDYPDFGDSQKWHSPREEAKAKLLALLQKAELAELNSFYEWVQSEGRLHSEIKAHYEDRIKQLTTSKDGA